MNEGEVNRNYYLLGSLGLLERTTEYCAFVFIRLQI